MTTDVTITVTLILQGLLYRRGSATVGHSSRFTATDGHRTQSCLPTAIEFSDSERMGNWVDQPAAGSRNLVP